MIISHDSSTKKDAGETFMTIPEFSNNKQAVLDYNRDFADYMTGIVTKGGNGGQLSLLNEH